MRCICLLVVLLSAGTAGAQPVSYQLQGDVALGQKPAIRITAVRKVTDLRIELDRDDGKHFTIRHAALSNGQAVTLPVGDGAAGKAAYKGTISVKVPGEGPWSDGLVFDTLVRAPIKVSYDADHLDLDKRVLQFKLSRTAASAELVVIGEDGKPLGTGAATYKQEPPGTWLPITWTQPPDTRVMIMKLRVIATDGLATSLELIPWSVTIDHEDVNFGVDSAVIDPREEAKLATSLARISEVVKRSERFVKMTLYIAGHTDTVGGAKNKQLSLDRARAIAQYFRRKQLAIPIAFAGFGESVPKIKTPDATDEPANRRADYVIGPTGAPPPFGGPYRKVRAAWQQLR